MKAHVFTFVALDRGAVLPFRRYSVRPDSKAGQHESLTHKKFFDFENVIKMEDHWLVVVGEVAFNCRDKHSWNSSVCDSCASDYEECRLLECDDVKSGSI
jgi:hypothetical protein